MQSALVLAALCLAAAEPRPYIIEPPAILLIAVIRFSPQQNYRLGPDDVLRVRLGATLPGRPLDGDFTVGADGTIDLGPVYGPVHVGGLSLVQAQQAITQLGLIRAGEIARLEVGLAQSRCVRHVLGPHLVRPDGTVGLGTCGEVHLASLTLAQAKQAIEEHLAQYLDNPEVSVGALVRKIEHQQPIGGPLLDSSVVRSIRQPPRHPPREIDWDKRVFATNSDVYQVLTDAEGQVYRFPATGKDTVLDAVYKIGGLPGGAAKKVIWVARPTPGHPEGKEVLAVDWAAIAEGNNATNYTLLPGDRVYVRPRVDVPPADLAPSPGPAEEAWESVERRLKRLWPFREKPASGNEPE